MNGREFRERFSRRAKKAGLSVSPGLLEKLWVYFQLLSKWNAKINLTGLDLDDPTPEGIDRLLIEPLIAAPLAAGAQSLIDIGSGGGSPALPLALGIQGVRLVMVEVKTRKSVFLREAARELGLDARVVTARHESLLADPSLHEAFDVLSVRAVRVEAHVLAALQAFVKPGGRVFHFRGAGDTTPLIHPPLELTTVQSLGEASRGQLLICTKSSDGRVPRGTRS